MYGVTAVGIYCGYLMNAFAFGVYSVPDIHTWKHLQNKAIFW